MAHNELILDSNVIDVAFSKSGTRIAVLMKDCFSIFLWPLKTRPVAAPILESSYPLPDALDNRPRQIAFINENEVYILKNSGPNNAFIERTALETRTTKIAYQAAESEELISLFPSLNHETLWISHVNQYGQPIAYFTVSMPSAEEFVATPYTQSPSVDSYWAKAAQLSEDEVMLSWTLACHLFLAYANFEASFDLYDKDRRPVRE